MRRSPGNPVEELDELRRLLFGQEQEELHDLREQITNEERRSNDLAAILPEAVRLSCDHGEELSQALRPVVEDSIRESIKKRPETFVDALRPIIGPMARQSGVERLRRLLQSLNHTLERTFSRQRLKWRFEALRTRKSFAEVVMQRSLVYRVEQLFLIHRETGTSLLHVTADPALSKDLRIMAAMLGAIHDFARDSFKVAEGSAIVEFRFRQQQVWIALGRYAYLAAVVRGNASRELRSTLEKTIENIHFLKSSALARFAGDVSPFESLRPELESCLSSQYGPTRRDGPLTYVWVMLAAAAAVAILGIALAMRSESKWKSFLVRLNAQPGLVVTEAQRGWFSRSFVSGLRDASAPDPATIAREAKLDPGRIGFQWKEYLALDPASVMERFKRRFGIPPSTKATISAGVLALSGSVPYDWLERVRREATLVPGIASLVDRDAVVTYDPGSVLRRFEEKFGLPERVHVVLAKSVLTLSGEATHGWLARVRSEATKMPGVSAIDERNVIDLDQRTLQQVKSIVENAFVYFVENKDDITPEGFSVLSRLPDQINRLVNAAKQTGVDVTLELRGYAGGPGDAPANADLGQRRANKVRDFLVSCGFETGALKPIGREEPLKGTSGEKPVPEECQRCVSFKVVSHVPAPGR
jgi:OOP family OmpA-OmpF porin